MKYNNKEYVCYLDLGVDFIRKKWKAVLLCHIKKGPIRYLQLQRLTKGISHKVLSETLKELELDGLIRKTTYPEAPPRVEFDLTDQGKFIVPALDILESFGKNKYKEKHTLK